MLYVLLNNSNINETTIVSEENNSKVLVFDPDSGEFQLVDKDSNIDHLDVLDEWA